MPPGIGGERVGQGLTLKCEARRCANGVGTAEILDSEGQGFRLLDGRLLAPRSFHGAALLKSGRVLVAGGIDAGWSPIDSAEVFDPSNSTFHAVGNTMRVPRMLAARIFAYVCKGYGEKGNQANPRSGSVENYRPDVWLPFAQRVTQRVTTPLQG